MRRRLPPLPAARLVLGTAHFGNVYGIANGGALLSEDDAGALLDIAWDAGIRTLDTASVYGRSEQVLGRLGAAARGFRIVTKAHGLTEGEAAVRRRVEASLENLGASRLDAVLAHLGTELAIPEAAAGWRALLRLRDEGVIGRLGVSVYDPAEALDVAERFEVMVVQLPGNLADRRMVEAGVFPELKRRGVEIHVRSLFLQGLLLMERAAAEAARPPAAGYLARLHGWLDDNRLTPLEACLGYAAGLHDADGLIVAAFSPAQLREILETAARGCPAVDFAPAACREPAVIDPRRWKD